MNNGDQLTTSLNSPLTAIRASAGTEAHSTMPAPHMMGIYPSESIQVRACPRPR